MNRYEAYCDYCGVDERTLYPLYDEHDIHVADLCSTCYEDETAVNNVL